MTALAMSPVPQQRSGNVLLPEVPSDEQQNASNTVQSKGNEVIKPVILQRNFIEFAANVFGFIGCRWELVVQWLVMEETDQVVWKAIQERDRKTIWCSCLVKNGFS